MPQSHADQPCAPPFLQALPANLTRYGLSQIINHLLQLGEPRRKALPNDTSSSASGSRPASAGIAGSHAQTYAPRPQLAPVLAESPVQPCSGAKRGREALGVSRPASGKLPCRVFAWQAALVVKPMLGLLLPMLATPNCPCSRLCCLPCH